MITEIWPGESRVHVKNGAQPGRNSKSRSRTFAKIGPEITGQRASRRDLLNMKENRNRGEGRAWKKKKQRASPRDNLSSRSSSSSSSSSRRRADCCSSLSPISDCFFKAPVAEDINYPASVNHVIYRPRPRGPRGSGRGGRRRTRRSKRRRRRRCRRRRTGGCRRGFSNTVGGSSIAREGVAPLPAEQNARRLLSTAAAISCSQSPKFIGDSKLSSSPPSPSLSLSRDQRGAPHLPTYIPACRRSIDLPQRGSPWILTADIGRAGFASFFAPAPCYVPSCCWLIHLAPAARSALFRCHRPDLDHVVAASS